MDLSFYDVVNGFVLSIGSNKQDGRIAIWRADPIEFLNIEPRFSVTDDLPHVNQLIRHPHRQSIGLRDIVNVIGGNQRSAAWHILNNDFRVTYYVFRHVTR